MTDIPAPAVPVGVSGEVEEAPRGCACHGDLYCGATPAVPVVHPEPGEGAHERAFAAARAVLTVEGYGRIGPQVLDAIVAAAVAAVRADLEEALALHTGLHQCLGGSWYADNDPTYRGTVATHGPCPTAALIRGRS